MERRPQFPDDENGQVLKRMHEDGDDLSIPREITFSVLFGSRAAGLGFVQAVHQKGFAASLDEEAYDDHSWDVSVVIHMRPEHAAVTRAEREIGETAALFGGMNDGWGCFSQP